MVRVLFVCMGNICRSPTAQGVFEELLRREGLTPWIEVDSAGTHAYHEGNAPDPRAQAAALRRGLDLSAQIARQVRSDDFERFDYILAMDRENLALLMERCPAPFGHKVSLFLGYAPHLGIEEVPDPYYGGVAGFDRVLDMVQAAAEGLLREIRARPPAA
ncbi:MAG: low molecular weight phosphotyrosine protein phosphatase [Gammaproteobacteria bacterium]|nr:low molecular weight phosphotyrosine protein phosphatase [Gammaproteobacteria bacterium]